MLLRLIRLEGRADIPAQIGLIQPEIHGDQGVFHGKAIYAVDCILQLTVARAVVNDLSPRRIAEGDLRVSEDEPRNHIRDERRLGSRLF